MLKASGAWRPIIDLSLLNKSVMGTKFRMETVQSVLSSIRKDDWMISLDLKDAYLQVPIHPNSRKYLRFSTPEGVYQFKVLPFGLKTSPQVFTRVMAPVSVLLLSKGIRMLRYLDDWLVQAPSLDTCIWARDQVLEMCIELGIQVNFVKSQLIPTQVATYLGLVIDSRLLRVSPTLKRQTTLLRMIEEFLSLEKQPAALWRSLLGHLSSLTQVIPGGRLRMRALQLCLRNQWDFFSDDVLISWDLQSQLDLRWWSQEGRLSSGCSLELVCPDQMFWSDASDVGWGAHMSEEAVSGLWSPTEKALSINLRELRAVRLGLLHFQQQIERCTVAVFCDSATAVAYLKKQGGTVVPLLNQETQQILRWAEDHRIVLVPQFILGKHNVVADSLSRKNQIVGSEWTLCLEVFQKVPYSGDGPRR